MIDPIRLADAGKRLTGKLAVSRMRRLAMVCLRDSGDIDVDLAFERSGRSGLRQMKGTIHAVVTVACQRCLGEMELELNALPFAILLRPGEEKGLSGDEPDLLVVDKPLQLNELVEDELILALPMFPMHDASICPAAGKPKPPGRPAGEDRENPFAVLKSLKRTDKY